MASTLPPPDDTEEPNPQHAARQPQVSGHEQKLIKASERNARRAADAELKAARKAERQSKGPGPWRTWVLPLLRTAIIAAIAVALVKLAFFPSQDSGASAETEYPGGLFVEPTVAAALDTVSNEVELAGSVVADAGVGVRANVAGTVTNVFVDNGQLVNQGERLLEVRWEVEPEVESGQTADLGEAAVAPSPSYRWQNIIAPSSGELSGFEILAGQSVEIGTELGSVAPPSFHIEAPLEAADQYRLTSELSAATVAITDGPADFECGDVKIVQAAASMPDGEEGVGTSNAALQCSIPADVRVFAGLAATVTIPAGVAENVLTLPTTAVLGSAESGVAFRLADDGSPEEIPVSLGLNDGQLVEITGGLAEGDEVMEFAPGAPVDECADPMTADPAVCFEYGVSSP